MASKLRQFVVYTKVTIASVMVLAAVAIVWMNRGNRTKFWPLAADQEVSTLWLMLGVAVGSVVLFWILTRTRRMLREVMELRKEKETAALRAEQEGLQKRLTEQERRLDEKIQQALSGDKSQA